MAACIQQSAACRKNELVSEPFYTSKMYAPSRTRGFAEKRSHLHHMRTVDDRSYHHENDNPVQMRTMNINIEAKEPSHDCHDDDENFEKESNLLVYGNPLWADEQSPYRAQVRPDDTNDVDPSGSNGPTIEDDDNDDADRQLAVAPPEHEYNMYSNSSSDDENREAGNGNGQYWEGPYQDTNGKSAWKYENFSPPEEQDCDLKQAVVNNRESMLWNGGASYRKDSSALTPQDEDYLYKNSDLLANFEVEGHFNLNNKGGRKVSPFRKEESRNAPYEESKSRRNMSKLDVAEKKEQMLELIKKTSQFDDTNSWTTDYTECYREPTPDTFSHPISKKFASLDMKEDANTFSHPLLKKFASLDTKEDTNTFSHPTSKKFTSHDVKEDANRVRKHRYEDDSDHAPVSRNITPFRSSSESEEFVMPSPAPQADVRELVSNKREFNKAEKLTKPNNVTFSDGNLQSMEEEILQLKKENGRLEKQIKDNGHKMDAFLKEKALWEQKKLAEMSTFNAFKEEETQRLKRERVKLEKQAKILTQLPSKKERNEIEDLRMKITNLAKDHQKKETLQNLTINRLRRTITDLTEQIHSLQEEVKRYERFLQAEWDTNEDGKKKTQTNKSGVNTEMYQSAAHAEPIAEPSMDKRTQMKPNRVSTMMQWTRSS